MFETFEFETLTPVGASLYFALALGVAFGLLAEITRFCLRRAIVGADRRQAAGTWLTALAVAVAGTGLAVWFDLISFADHRLSVSELPILALLVGGLAFGVGMVLTRGCASRLTVLTGSGNLRALFVIVLFAITAHATLKGVLAPIRTTLGQVTLNVGEYGSLSALPGGAPVWSTLIALAALAIALRSGIRPGQMLLAALLGALVPLAWVGTGYVLFDEFDPIAMESLSFTSPSAETLFYTIASTAISAGFGPGLFAGAILGAALSALIFGRFQWQSFESPRQTGRYALGAVLMGLGGVLAGGCTLGAGLSGIPTLGLSAFVAILAIVAGAAIAGRLLNETPSVSGGSQATPTPQPAE
ncbi:YeeE/YedE family protein [Rhodobacteraceae bacterium D3-12]|nr:YeeE/YedE family protein [Rhodobacteraceae bacterium D3-12]